MGALGTVAKGGAAAGLVALGIFEVGVEGHAQRIGGIIEAGEGIIITPEFAGVGPVGANGEEGDCDWASRTTRSRTPR